MLVSNSSWSKAFAVVCNPTLVQDEQPLVAVHLHNASGGNRKLTRLVHERRPAQGNRVERRRVLDGDQFQAFGLAFGLVDPAVLRKEFPLIWVFEPNVSGGLAPSLAYKDQQNQRNECPHEITILMRKIDNAE